MDIILRCLVRGLYEATMIVSVLYAPRWPFHPIHTRRTLIVWDHGIFDQELYDHDHESEDGVGHRVFATYFRQTTPAEASMYHPISILIKSILCLKIVHRPIARLYVEFSIIFFDSNDICYSKKVQKKGELKISQSLINNNYSLFFKRK